MLTQTVPWKEIKASVDREGNYLHAAGCLLDELPPERRALFATLLRLAFRGRTAQFLLVGLGRMKGRRWQWTIQPARNASQLAGEAQPIEAAEVTCIELPRSRPPAPHFAFAPEAMEASTH